MEYTHQLGLRLSRLAIGTVQFGIPYGINNRTGQPSRAQIRQILDLAFEAGVNVLDTARAYGGSEQILGEVLRPQERRDELIIVTKLDPMTEPLSVQEVRDRVRASVRTSLHYLRIEQIPIYLLHRPEHLFAYGGVIMEELIRLRDRGMIGHLGISVYTPEESEQALNMEGIEAVQVPLNLFDHRPIQSGFLSRAQARGMAVFIRSVFLQGLLLMEPEEVPAELNDALPFKEALWEMCMDTGRTAAELALQFALRVEGVTSVLVGVETVAQIQEDLKLFNAPPLDLPVIKEIRERFKSVPEHVVNPSRWPK